MDPFTRSSLPPVSHQVIHSPTVCSHNLICASEYQGEHRRSSAVVTQPLGMGEYYLPLGSMHVPYHGTQPSFPVSPMSYRPPYHYPFETVGQFQHQRASSASSQGSQEKIHDEQEVPYGQQQNMLHQYHSGDIVQPSISCASTASSDNDAHPLEALDSIGMSIPLLKSEVGSEDVRQLALPPINNDKGFDSLNLTKETRYASAEVLSTMQDPYFGDHNPAGSAEPNFSASEPSPAPKPTKGKKPSSTKVSEKRRQQNRAAQRAMRERRKKAAQHQEVHMSTILAENVFLRAKVAQLSQQLSNMLLHDTNTPGSHHWSLTTPQVSQPPIMSPPTINNHLTKGQSAAPERATPISSSMSFSQSHVMFPSSRISGQTSCEGPAMSYFGAAPYNSEYVRQGPGFTGNTDLSGPLTASNYSRPMTAEENSIDNYSHYGRWQDATANEALAFGTKSPMTDVPGQLPPIPTLSTDCGSIQTASTLASPTQASRETF